MENNNIKVHPPWYARGTPIINTRDGPPMAISDKPLFAIRGGPSARGKTGECRNAGMWECMNEDGSRKTEVGSRKPEDQRRVKPRGIICPWLTLRQINAVKSLDVDRLEERSADDFVFDLSAYAVPDNVKMEDRCEERSAVNWKINAVKSMDVDRLEERSAVGPGVAAVDFDLSAYAVPDNVKILEDNVKILEDNVKMKDNVKMR